MNSTPQWLFSVLIFLLAGFPLSWSSTTNVLSPVSNLEQSLTASSTQGTILAIKSKIRSKSTQENPDRVSFNSVSCDEEEEEIPCVLVLSLSNNNQNTGGSPSTSSTTSVIEQHDLNIEDLITSSGDCYEGSKKLIRLSDGYQSPNTKMLHVMGTSYARDPVICGMTGFLPDVRHLIKYTARLISNHDFVYAPSSSSSSMRIQKHIILPISKYLRQVAFSGGSGRPFGVQILFLSASSSSRVNDMDIYTLDPSGGYKFWNSGATVIGKKAFLARQTLYSELVNLHQKNKNKKDGGSNTKEEEEEEEKETPVTTTSISSTTNDVKEALQIGIKVLLHTLKDDMSNDSSFDINNKDKDDTIEEAQYKLLQEHLEKVDGMIILGGSHKGECFSLSPSLILGLSK